MESSTKPAAAPSTATLKIVADVRSPHPIPPLITGKFCEHLGSNIYNGMSAQILRNPTFADFPFGAGGETPDGRSRFLSDEEKIATQIGNLASRINWPQADIPRLVEARSDGLAFWWVRRGARQDVHVSPDAATNGRAQRVEIRKAGDGVAQWIWLPTHRTRSFEFELSARSPNLKSLVIELAAQGAKDSAAQARVEGISDNWLTIKGTLRLPESAPADAIYRLSLLAPSRARSSSSACCSIPPIT